MIVINVWQKCLLTVSMRPGDYMLSFPNSNSFHLVLIFFLPSKFFFSKEILKLLTASLVTSCFCAETHTHQKAHAEGAEMMLLESH